MTELIDSVAAAIAEVLTRDRPHPASGRPYCLLIVEDEDAKEMARAAIKALRNFDTSDFTFTEAEAIRRLIYEASGH
jgi:hypothetical protein